MRKIVILFAVLAVALSSCNRGYKTSENGLKYKMHKENSSEEKSQIGDMILVQLVAKTESGTVLIDSRKEKLPLYIFIEEPLYKGDFMEGFKMLTKGDSASFLVSADSLKKYGQLYIPDSLKTNQNIIFEVRMDSLITKKALELEKSKKMKEFKKIEDQTIAEYIKNNNIKELPNEMGLYIISVKKGKGAKVEPGKKVSINYVGRFLDGKVFDTNIASVAKENNMFEPQRPYEIFSFTLGKGEVIPGFDHGVSSMSIGDKIKLIIPSALGYGERGASNVIPPYTPLLFEIELVKAE